MSAPTILLEARPGAGKTTVARRLVKLLEGRGISVSGFTTEEIREGRRRVGFRVESASGDGAVLAHVDLPGPPRVGKYGVDLQAFERVALPALDSPPAGAVVVIDELGKMELASERFRRRVLELLDAPITTVATVHAFRDPFTDQLKARPGIDLIKLTRTNRGALPTQLLERVVDQR